MRASSPWRCPTGGSRRSSTGGDSPGRVRGEPGGADLRAGRWRSSSDQATPTAVVIPHRFRGFDYVEMFERILASRLAKPAPRGRRPSRRSAPGGVRTRSMIAGRRRARATVGRRRRHLLLLYTSGTTADPQAACCTVTTRSLYEVVDHRPVRPRSNDDAVFMPSPVTHIAGFLYAFMLPFVTGQRPRVCSTQWDPAPARRPRRAGVVPFHRSRRPRSCTDWWRSTRARGSSPLSQLPLRWRRRAAGTGAPRA